MDNAPLERAVPADPIDAVVDAFDSHRFVAIVVSGFEEEHRFRLSLLNDPRFVSRVDDIVVEFGGSRYQDVMDRFIAGDDVPYGELKRSWQQTTQPHHVSDAPIYEEFSGRFGGSMTNCLIRKNSASAGRTTNRLGADRRFRRPAAVAPTADAVRGRPCRTRGNIEKPRRALLLFAPGHVLEESPLVEVIQGRGLSLFKIWTTNTEELSALEPSVASWPTPSIALVKGTILGTTDLRGFYLENAPPGRFEDQFDPILYLGPPASLTYSEIAPELCSDAEYLSFRIPRLELAARNGAAGFLAEFRARCASVGSPLPE